MTDTPDQPDAGTPEHPLEARLAALETAQQVRELPARYAFAYGALDVEALAECFAQDVQARSGAQGRAAVQEQFDAGCRGDRGVRLALLHVGTHAIETDEHGRLTGRVLCHAEVERADGSWFHQAIHYGDRYRETADGWRFASQRAHELIYGVTAGERPNDAPRADWPARDVGTGTVPHRWRTWRDFWAAEER
jgi:hypothetical protein